MDRTLETKAPVNPDRDQSEALLNPDRDQFNMIEQANSSAWLPVVIHRYIINAF
jgi:hypothetical protein